MEGYLFGSEEEQEAHFELTEAVAAREIKESAHHSQQQAQHKITPTYCEFERVVDEEGNLGCGNCHQCDYPA